ncbi:MAG TPA: DUF4835 domain-containing protein [Bacteroidales bacterium]|jgi:hypothetical protein|nr:DUF4835 domain-containing protein [Bacteroidales bacterium]
MKCLTLFFTALISIGIHAQELDCNVSVSSSRIQGTNKQIFTTMQEALNDFMNNTTWTNYVYEGHERIECNILVDISEQISANEFKARLQIQARRPVYGSSFNSVILNYVDDDVQFVYQEFDPIEYSENNFISNLSSLLSFYAYIIIGLDGDTFSPLGGDEAFQNAERILNAAQGSGYIGWIGSDSQKRKNRYWLIENLTDTEYEPIRNFYYNYHRNGLDLMEKSVEQGRAGVTDAIMMLEKFATNKPDPFTYLLTIVLETKSNEFVDIYSQAQTSEKQRMKRILLNIDPAGSRKYSKLDQ